jgi:DNA-binding transcriptional regulator YiaG
MATETMTAEDKLLVRLRSRRKLPPPDERKLIREKANVSLRELAAAVGVSHMAIVRWEEGAQPADPEHVATYGRLLDELRRLA